MRVLIGEGVFGVRRVHSARGVDISSCLRIGMNSEQSVDGVKLSWSWIPKNAFSDGVRTRSNETSHIISQRQLTTNAECW